MRLRIVKYMKLKVAKKLLYFFIFFTYSILLLSILIYPSSTLFTIQYKRNIYMNSIYIYIVYIYIYILYILIAQSAGHFESFLKKMF